MGHQIMMEKGRVTDLGIHIDPLGLIEERGLIEELGLAEECGLTEERGVRGGRVTAERNLIEECGDMGRGTARGVSADGVIAGAETPRGPGPEARQEWQLFRAAVAKGRALLRVYVHSRKVRAAGRALADALAESREVSSWPGDRLPVGAEISEQVEQLTRRLTLELQTHGRLEQLLRTAGGHSVPAH